MVYGIYNVEVDSRGYIQEPPGRCIEVEVPRHEAVKTHSQTKQILACHVDNAGHARTTSSWSYYYKSWLS